MKKLIFSFFCCLVLAITNNSRAQLTTIYHFQDSISGDSPNNGPYFDGTYIYGTNSTGGSNDMGVIYRLLPDGTNFTVLKDYSDTSEGRRPLCTLVSDAGYLYGTTRMGGANDAGTFFRMMPDGSGYTVLYSFGSLSYPVETPIKVGAQFYGTTPSGGTYGHGTIYRIQPDGTGITTLFHFQNSVNGNSPGRLYSDGTYLYGCTYSGATNGDGALWRILLDGTGFHLLHEFNGTDGQYPQCAVVSDGTYLYGTTFSGGANNTGTIFKIMPDGTGFSTIKDFAVADGYYPEFTLSYVHSRLYGCGAMGGANGAGTFFSIHTDGTNFTVLDNFTIAGGANAQGNLANDGTHFYGILLGGGANMQGAVFKYQYSAADIPSEEESEVFSLFPNPANEQVSIFLHNQTATNISLIDNNGKIIFTQQGDISGYTVFQLDQIPSGMYYIQVKTAEGKSATQTLVVNH